MAWSAQRKVSVAVLGLAVGALVVDRVVLSDSISGPQLASAGDLITAAADLLVAQPSEKVSPEVPKEQAALADLAKSLRGLGIETPALATLEESFALAPPPSATPIAAAPAAEVPVGEPPLVSAVLSGRTPRAIIAGKPVSVGAEIDGWLVAFVGQGRVVFERDGQRIERLVMRIQGLPQAVR